MKQTHRQLKRFRHIFNKTLFL